MQEGKEDFNKEYKELVRNIDLAHPLKKPSLLLHACCGPCLTYPLSELVKHFDVTVAYINPNIYPEAEYHKREEELSKFVTGFNKENGLDVKVVAFPYMYEEYLKAVKGHENDKEGGARCTLCHRLRLSLSYKYAKDNGYDYFTTVMTVSSKKPSVLINQIGKGLQEAYLSPIYLISDFRKENGTLKGIKIAKKFNLYRQNYCGCSFSLQEREESDKQKKKSELAKKAG